MNNKEPERREVFRGYFRECLIHLARCFMAYSPSGLQRVGVEMQLMADFCGVKGSTMQGWLSKALSLAEKTPWDVLDGEKRLRMICCLDVLGYYVFELRKLESMARGMLELIGYNIVRAKDLGKLLGYNRSDGQYSVSVLRAIKSRGRMSQEARSRLQGVLEDKGEELAKKKEEARTSCRFSFSLKGFDNSKQILVRTDTMEELLALLNDGKNRRALKKSLEGSSASIELVFMLFSAFEDLPLQLVQVPNGFSEYQRSTLLALHDTMSELRYDLSWKISED